MKWSLRNLFKKSRANPYGWSGNYSSWVEAKAQCDGYEADHIVEKVKTAMLLVKNGQAVYERDSVVFDKIDYSWPLLSAILWIAHQKKSQINLIDFGGSLGSTYFQNKSYLNILHKVQWNIVEQDNFVNIGKKFFQDDILKFFTDLATCKQMTQANTLLISSSLQYLEDPFKMINIIKNLQFDYIILDRTGFADIPNHIITIQRVPPWIYDASYPCWVFNYNKFLNLLTDQYEVLAEFDAFIGAQYKVNDRNAGDRGVFLKLKNSSSESPGQKTHQG